MNNLLSEFVDMRVGLVGNINAGKSTLFNRLLGKYRAIVTNFPGTTREKVSDVAELVEGFSVVFTDSPGLEKFENELEMIEDIVDESDVLVFVLDGKRGVTNRDYEIKDMIMKKGKKDNTVVVVNKLDGKVGSEEEDYMLSEFYELGFSSLVGVSSKEGEGITLLREKILETGKQIGISDYLEYPSDEGLNHVGIVGRPNVGKSTLLNKLGGEEYALVDETPGTTLDYIFTDILYKGSKYRIYDTAGIRKKGKISGLERIAYNKTISMLDYVRPVVVLLIDAEEGVTHRDKTLFGDILSIQLPVIVVVNKTDKFRNDNEFKAFFDRMVSSFDFAKRVPILKISGKTGVGFPQMFLWIDYINKEHKKRVETSKINEVLNRAWLQNPPRFPKNKICKFYYISQIQSGPPRFLVFVNKKEFVNFAFKKWIENNIRKNFGFLGVPIALEFRERGSE